MIAILLQQLVVKDNSMQVFKYKMITIAAFWALTALMVFSFPLSNQALEKTLSDNHVSEQKLILVSSESFKNS